ncbi:MAG: riboflavin synthase [Myxococcota bacterium]|nr:riboflavin synthase [Myxococcota bacterium]
MFTGIVTATGRIETVETVPEGLRLRVTASWAEPDFVLGESIALDGACMTVVAFEGSQFEVEVSSESLARTTLGDFQPGRRVNLERALAIGDRLGGHFVSGHVDGMGVIESITPAGDCLSYCLSVPTELLRYLVSKGSLCVDGISLTVNSLDDGKAQVALMIVPHTQQETSLRDKGPGDAVNLEVDLLGKYVERLLDRS